MLYKSIEYVIMRITSMKLAAYIFFRMHEKYYYTRTFYKLLNVKYKHKTLAF